jgi:hypothetical protein
VSGDGTKRGSFVVYARLRGGGGFKLGDNARGGGELARVTADDLKGPSNGAQSRFDCVSIILRCSWLVGSNVGPVGGSIEYGFLRGEGESTERMLSRLLAALPKDSAEATSGDAGRANEGERGRTEPDPETEKRLLRERTPLGKRGDAGRDGGRELERTFSDGDDSSLEDPFCRVLVASSGALIDGLVGDESIPCMRIDNITSKSPRGSGTPDELVRIPRPARTDLA